MRTEIHAFAVDAVEDDFRSGLESTLGARSEARRLIGEYSFRRRGLLISIGLSTLIILLLVIVIRRVDAMRPREQQPSS
jgi:hypothetical protein